MKGQEDQFTIELLTRRPRNLRAARIETLVPHERRKHMAPAFVAIAFFVFLLFLLAAAASQLGGVADSATGIVRARNFLLGLFLISGSLAWTVLMVEFYYRSVSRPVPFFRITKGGEEKIIYLTLPAALLLYRLRALKRAQSEIAIHDIRTVLTTDPYATQLFFRLGLSEEELDFSATEDTAVISREEFFASLVSSIPKDSDMLTARECVYVLYEKDTVFREVLFAKEVREKELIGAAEWVSSIKTHEETASRWWERGRLSRMPHLGAALLFGYTFVLDKYAHDISPGTQGNIVANGSAHGQELKALEEILSRSGNTNVIMVGDPGVGKMAILEELVRHAAEGTVPASLLEKRFVSMDASSLTASTKEKGLLEELIIKLMNEATSAGNVVLVMENLPVFVESASHMGVDILSLMEPYLEGSSLQVVAFTDPDAYHRILEQNVVVTKVFSKVDVREPSTEATTYILQEVSVDLEKKTGILFTYQALEAASEMADRYVTQGVMPEKAIDLLDRAAASVAQTGRRIVRKADIGEAVEKQTHIPVANAEGGEAEKLLHMEAFLHQRVIGQDIAVTAVANALRRARSGLHAGKRPIGSFLFLGPTGVGKTETAKALAEVYFGADTAMTRFDMSEFQGTDGIDKLIGSFVTKEPGVLSNALRTKPFSLLLFDELEKSSQDVINLFLQILEEGSFTDAFGKKVSARDTIIITTSNAGSNVIWDMVQAGKDPADLQSEVVNTVRTQGIFAPEILNRFDAIVVYHPLKREHLLKIAHLLLIGLQKRLKKQDVGLTITEPLIEKIVEIGYDPVMGARPMRRAITDKVEQIIARKLLEGVLKRGDTFTFSEEDIMALK
ncbi:MAG: hypothetical protein COU90_02285 [Candidatus Ryanbacteria bacterium CG10_big_fil_rev_8_21_14_0_10_43_42]|uniref:Clp R domain-containing protein n=1 Tax=Candidatus Ryanbacteria bacterium CG10_big_fil_rev_8_21_14_0_10_43_42 TaxID=1974864 RepID=A0A2M8KXM6_9BACT|nr:MAG: hypothetical protein COU90_02285 [Candidatus Ryanbacteria bacterium CG10_big_fil_rev_8_21_14_0_10_43_42]